MNRLVPLLVVCSLLAACAGTRQRPAPAPIPDPPASNSTTSGTAKTKPYEIFGERYYPITDASGYRERGVASWYGRKFHGRKTANGERYDMYGYTAAHTTLPLPTWVKVTNLRNGASVTVRVNDRGPFVKNRLIDLSYSAALQLGMVADGTTLVEVEAIASAPAGSATAQQSTPPAAANTITAERSDTVGAGADVTTTSTVAAPASPAAVPNPMIYVQVGAFGEIENAQRLQTTLYNAGIAEVRLNDGDLEGIPVYRVQIGPIAGVLEYDVLIAQLESIGISNTHLVTQ